MRAALAEEDESVRALKQNALERGRVRRGIVKIDLDPSVGVGRSRAATTDLEILFLYDFLASWILRRSASRAVKTRA